MANPNMVPAGDELSYQGRVEEEQEVHSLVETLRGDPHVGYAMPLLGAQEERPWGDDALVFAAPTDDTALSKEGARALTAWSREVASAYGLAPDDPVAGYYEGYDSAGQRFGAFIFGGLRQPGPGQARVIVYPSRALATQAYEEQRQLQAQYVEARDGYLGARERGEQVLPDPPYPLEHTTSLLYEVMVPTRNYRP